jgi:hypothetical protein
MKRHSPRSQGQPVPESVPERETPAILTPKPAEKGLLRTFTSLQTVAPDHLRGRVMSVYVLFFDGSVPLGYLLTGWLSGLYGVSIAVLICALLSLMVAGAGWMWGHQTFSGESYAKAMEAPLDESTLSLKKQKMHTKEFPQHNSLYIAR